MTSVPRAPNQSDTDCRLGLSLSRLIADARTSPSTMVLSVDGYSNRGKRRFRGEADSRWPTTSGAAGALRSWDDRYHPTQTNRETAVMHPRTGEHAWQVTA